MRVYSTQKLRFLRPGVSLLTAPTSPAEGGTATQLVMEQRDFTKAFFEIEPNVFSDNVPDWVAKETAFVWALQDGTIRIVQETPQVSVPSPAQPTVDTTAQTSADLEAQADAQQAAEKKTKK
jgi:hypothetical protein